MQEAQPNLFTRPDTFFGVCEGLGRDLGIHPNIFRMVLAGLVFWSPMTGIAVYAAAGALVALTRFLFPDPRPAAAPAAVDTTPMAANAAAQAKEADQYPLPLAA